MRFFFPIIFFSLVLISCGSDDLSNTRAYAEGKITSNDLQSVQITLISSDKTIAQTAPTSTGSFVVSGPMISENFQVKLNSKIQSFSTEKPNCTLSSDSLSIIIPNGSSYIYFDEIKLKR